MNCHENLDMTYTWVATCKKVLNAYANREGSGGLGRRECKKGA